MMTAKEFATVKRLQGARDGAMRYAHTIKADGARNHYKNVRKSIREQVKRARRDNAKLVAIKRVGSARPVTVVMQALLRRIAQVREAAVLWARERIAEVAADLAKHGWDLEQAAPYDRSHTSWDRAERARQLVRNAKHNFYAKLTLAAEGYGYGRPGEPNVRVMNAEAGERFIRQCVEDAEASYISFVFKMDAKVGACTAAHIDERNVWSYSHLYVTTAAGAQQIWRTQQIENRSVLGKYFPQWPSRQVKEAK